MATRQETQDKRRKMRESIIESSRSGQVAPGELFPTVRDLARQYNLSINLASEVVQSLVAEGVLYARPGVGIIAGNPRHARPGAYLFVLPADATRQSVAANYLGTVQRGFEVAIAQLGGACLTLEAGQVSQYASDGQLPLLAGVFAIDADTLDALPVADKLPRVYFGEPVVSKPLKVPSCDVVRFDDLNGGVQATRYLLAAGHESIGFLALHASGIPGDFAWSAEREKGWRKAMAEAGKSCKSLAFHPSHTPSWRLQSERPAFHGAEQMEAAREAVEPLLSMIRKRKVTAVIAANFYAARTLFTVLQESLIAAESWPAVVCFDSIDGLDNYVISALNLPWDDVGKAGAQLLWERNVGRLRGPDTVRLVPMQLIPRLTCRFDWTETSSMVVPHLEVLSMPHTGHGLVKAAA